MRAIDEHADLPHGLAASPGVSFWTRAGTSVLARPRLWGVAARQARRLARTRWWSRPPYLPLPDADYLRFRFETQYGGAPPEARDVVAYLEWCRAMEGLAKAHTPPTGRR